MIPPIRFRPGQGSWHAWSQTWRAFVFFFKSYGDHRDLHGDEHSFPTRRSSDLQQYGFNPLDPSDAALDPDGDGLTNLQERSEEHTSELQSLITISYAVFCLK